MLSSRQESRQVLARTSRAIANKSAPTQIKTDPPDSLAPNATAVVLISLLHFSAEAFYCYARYNITQQTGYLLGSLGSALFASFGLWVLLFGGQPGHRSKRTGADKRTSGFPFGNAEASKRRSKKAE